MNPWFGLIAGPALCTLGVVTLRNPRRVSKFSDLGFRAIYRASGARYEGSRAERFTLATARMGGVLSLVLGIGVLIGGAIGLAAN